jgi:HAD superfamily hydrolase (TIGR01509 family)
MATFKELLQLSFKSEDTEEWLDVHFTRPVGLVFALLWNRLGIHPNVITILSIFLGIGAGWMFHFADVPHNLCGVLLLMLANFCDSTDGQMARLTGKKTLVGRVLDGFSGDVWFAAIYVGIVVRLWHQPLPGTEVPWGVLGFLLCAVAGFLFHASQSSLADYYRQIHLYFLLGKSGSELDNYRQQRAIYEQLPKRDLFSRAFYYNYANYCKSQEKRTPCFQQFFSRWRQQPPAEVRERFLQGSRPLMKYTNLLTFNARAITLYAACLLDCPWVYPLMEITAFQLMYVYMHRTHERLCRYLTPDKGYIFDYGGTLDTGGRHWREVIWQAYERRQVPVTEQLFREAYVFVERQLGAQSLVKPDFTFRQLLDLKVRLQLEYLVQKGLDSSAMERYHDIIVDDLYALAQRETAHSVAVLRQLTDGPKVLVSNFYGNLSVVLHEFGFDGCFLHVVESAVVGVRKPDPQIFRLGIEALGMSPWNVVVVGDSLENDIRPARQLGCRTVWLQGDISVLLSNQNQINES